MNEFKTKLILLVARLSEESCQNILARIFQRIGESTLLPNEVTAVAKFSNKTWDESDHPRAEDGKFTNGPDANHGSSHNYSPKGKDRADMLKDEVKKWDKYGKEMPKDRRLTELRKEIAKQEKKLKWYKEGSINWVRVAADLQQKKRDLAELARDIKSEKRMKIEDVISKRIEKKNEKKSSLNQKRINRYYEIQDKMDYIEEMYGDRERGVGFNWPDTQDAYEDRKRYRKLQRESKRLEGQIDWDEIDNSENPDEDENHPENPPLADRLADIKKRYPMLSKKEEEAPKGESVIDKFGLKVSKPRK